MREDTNIKGADMESDFWLIIYSVPEDTDFKGADRELDFWLIYSVPRSFSFTRAMLRENPGDELVLSSL